MRNTQLGFRVKNVLDNFTKIKLGNIPCQQI